jgi:hypothetical protein
MFTHQIHEDENLLNTYRKHELTLVPKIFQVFILIFIPWFFGLKYDFVFSAGWHTNLFLLWTILVGFFAVHTFLVWTINVYLVTTKRLLHIAHTGLFKKMVTETPLDRILNVSFRTTGIFSTLFRYGDVLVQIVGLDHPLVLKDVPNPVQVKDSIWRMHLEYGGDQKITYTQPEIARADAHIPYAPQHVTPKIIVKPKRDV